MVERAFVGSLPGSNRAGDEKVSEDRTEDGFTEPLVEEPQELMPLVTGDVGDAPPDALAGYIRNRPYEAILLTGAAGLALGLLIGLRA
jgi:hypothetical protein